MLLKQVFKIFANPYLSLTHGLIMISAIDLWRKALVILHFAPFTYYQHDSVLNVFLQCCDEIKSLTPPL